MELDPIPEFLTIVGKSSADQTYITAKAADTPNLPMFARATVIQLRAVNYDSLLLLFEKLTNAMQSVSFGR